MQKSREEKDPRRQKFAKTRVVCPECSSGDASCMVIDQRYLFINCDRCGEYMLTQSMGEVRRLKVEPLHSKEFYEALGEFVSAFAMAESGVDAAIGAICAYCDREDLSRRRLQTLNMKLKFISEAAKRAELAKFYDRLTEALPHLRGLARRRNYYVHGFYEMRQAPARFQKYRLDQKSSSISELETTIEKIKEDKAAAMASAICMMRVALLIRESMI